jgi:hypothetical protein
MKKVFIWSICSTCNEPVAIIEPCTELGYNAFPTTNFHGELSVEETEKVRQTLIQKLRENGEHDKSKAIELNTRVIEIEFK